MKLGGRSQTKASDRFIDALVRHPVTVVVLLSEVALILGSTGTPPLAVWRVLVIPAWVAHMVLSLLVGPHYWVLLALTVAGGFGIDRLMRRALDAG